MTSLCNIQKTFVLDDLQCIKYNNNFIFERVNFVSVLRST